MGDERKNSGICPWVVAALIGLPVLYVLSIGPACWITSFVELGGNSVSVVYQPVMWGAVGGDLRRMMATSFIGIVALLRDRIGI